MKLSDQQKQAVEYIGSPTLVVSGAGSGKTTVLTNKVASLIRNRYDSRRILAITFTNKAADEMKTRLTDLTGLPLKEFPWVRTFHSAAYRILRTHCPLLGYSTPIQIYASYQQKKLLEEIVTGMNFDKKHVPAVLANISKAKNSGDPLAYFDRKSRVSRIRLIEVYKVYEKKLFGRNAVDFDNILLMTRNLLRDHEDIREYYRDLFQYVLCDEYQDTNPLQALLTDLFVKDGNLFCVGDDWQSIYRFRGSNVDHFLSFQKKYRDARVFRLEQNYRSADEIVQTANHLIGHNTHKMDKRCFSKKYGGTVDFNEFSDERREAEWVGRKAGTLASLEIPYSRIAVLYRTKFCSLSFEKAFRRLGIPYQMMGSKGFFERKEILDINSYLKSAVFIKDDVSFDRILNLQSGIGKKTIEKIGEVRTDGMSLQEAVRKVMAERVMGKKIHGILKNLTQMLDAIRDMKPGHAIHKILSDFDYMAYLEKYSKSNSTDFVARKENIEELIWSASKKDTIPDYLEEADLLQEDKADDEEDEDKGRGVKLSTVHASKGLEYFAVFIVGCEEELFPHWKSTGSNAELEEERRLMYVAITRAEKYLFISRTAFRRGQQARKSRFWKEIQDALN